MKSAVAAAVLAAALTAVAMGTAGTAADPQVAALQKRVTKLEKDVKALQKNQKTIVGGVVVAYAGLACASAATGDALQTTWAVIDQMAQATQAGKTYFGPQTPLNDQKGCSDLGVARQVPNTIPPSLATLTGLINFFYAPSG